MQRIPGLVLAVAVAAGLAACENPAEPVGDGLSIADGTAAVSAGKGPGGEAGYQVTITNLTSSGQAFTPPLVVTHRRPLSLFGVGEPASEGLQQIAENGNLAPLHAWLLEARHADEVVIAPSGAVPPLQPGETVELGIGSERGAKYLSFVSMLICTNDGFTGVNAQRLPAGVGETVDLTVGAYDAGTELNTEDFADLVPPCPVLSGVPSSDAGTGMTNPALAEGGVVRMHPGIQGVDDLSVAIHGWTDPVARVVIERVH